MDPTTEQSMAMLDMWSSKLVQYNAAMGIVLVIYDCLLTLKDEVCLILMFRGVCLSLLTFGR
jgi:hypothetical protein